MKTMKANNTIPPLKIKVSDYMNNYILDFDTTIFLMTVSLHLGGEINREKMLAMFRSIKNEGFPFGKINRVRHLFHWKSAHTDIWFNDENMHNIYREVYDNPYTTKKDELSFQEVMDHISLLLGKPYNYCLDWMRDQIVFKIFNASEYMIPYYFNNLGLSLKLQRYDDFEVSGYCCDDCDGDYEHYKSYRYDAYVLKRGKEDIANLFDSLKKKYQKQ
jgi:hypothetical protein